MVYGAGAQLFVLEFVICALGFGVRIEYLFQQSDDAEIFSLLFLFAAVVFAKPIVKKVYRGRYTILLFFDIRFGAGRCPSDRISIEFTIWNTQLLIEKID